PIPVASALLEGAVAPTLADHAAGVGADLVVMTTHGRGALGRFWLGSVADALVRQLPMPLLLARPHGGEPDLAAAPLPRHLLLPLDGSALAEEMAGAARDLAALAGARVTLLRVVRPVLPPPYPVEGYTVEDMARSLLERVEAVQREV